MTPPSFGVEALEDLLQPGALVVVEPARDAEALALRDEDDEAAGQRDLGREPRALRLHRVLDRLDEDLSGRAGSGPGSSCRAGVALELGHDDLVDVEEAVLLEADLDEGGLHARAGRCRPCRGRCCRRSSGARDARGRPRRRGRPRGSATRCSPTSTEISSSRLAFGSGARFCGTRRRLPCWLARRSCRWLRSLLRWLPLRPLARVRSRRGRLRRASSSALRRRSARGAASRRASCARARRGCRGGASWRARLPPSVGRAAASAAVSAVVSCRAGCVCRRRGRLLGRLLALSAEPG